MEEQEKRMIELMFQAPFYEIEFIAAKPAKDGISRYKFMADREKSIDQNIQEQLEIMRKNSDYSGINIIQVKIESNYYI